MWIESHQSLRKHPKTLRAARALGVCEVHLIGHLHCLWWWAMDYAPDGDLSSYTDTDIAAAAEWDGDAAQFVAALRDAAKIGDRPGFLEMREDRLHIHDWWEYGGKLIAKRDAEAARKRDTRRKTDSPTTEPRPQDVRRTSAGHPQDVRLNRTVQDSTNTTGQTGQDRTPSTRASAPAAGHKSPANGAGDDGAVAVTAAAPVLSPEQAVAREFVQMVAPDFRDLDGFIRAQKNPRRVAYWALAAGQDVMRIDNPAGLIRSMIEKDPDAWPNLPVELIDKYKNAVSKRQRAGNGRLQ